MPSHLSLSLSLSLCLFFFLSLSGSGSKSATGLLEWVEIDSALDAFVMTNHQTAFSQSKYFTLANLRMLPVKENNICTWTLGWWDPQCIVYHNCCVVEGLKFKFWVMSSVPNPHPLYSHPLMQIENCVPEYLLLES